MRMLPTLRGIDHIDNVGDSSWAKLPAAGVRLRVEFTPEGWTYSVYYLRSKTYLLMPQRVNTEEQGQFLAERWAIGAGLLDATMPLKWKQNSRE
jgi:hypothetical protein